MEPQKTPSPITTRPVSTAGKGGKSETVDDEKASLARPSSLPSFLQRKTVASDEEEKKEKELREMRMAKKQISPWSFNK